MAQKALRKVVDLVPMSVDDGSARALLFTPEEKAWDEVEAEPSLEKLMAVAANTLAHDPPPGGAFRFVEVEAPGLRFVLGEGAVSGTETVLSPLPTHVKSIKFVKMEGEKPVIVHELKPSGLAIAFEGGLALKGGGEFDLVIVEGAELTRLLFPHELLLERIKAGEKKARRRRKSRKKAKAKKSRKKRKKPRGRR